MGEAHCYDPNEEAKLRKVIGALGADLFEQKIHSLGQALLAKEARSSSSNVRLSSFVSLGFGCRLRAGPSKAQCGDGSFEDVARIVARPAVVDDVAVGLGD